MSCYDPLAMIRGIDTETGEIIFKFNGKYDPEKAKDMNETNYHEGEVLPVYYKIPCGKCLGCKLDYSRSWADRMLMEYYSFGKKAIFLTLTYNDQNLPLVYRDDFPLYPTLRKYDLQNFLKLLRYYFSDRKIRYFSCGEYGSNTLRPHYHLIIFGLSLEDFNDKRTCQKNELNQVSFTSKYLEDIWNKGFILFSDVSFQTMSYVSRYSAKKVFGDNLRPGPEAEETFVTMSRRPGLGFDFIKDNPEFFRERKKFLSDGINVKRVYFPRYGNKILEEKYGDDYNDRVKKSIDGIVDRDLLKLWKTDLPYDQLMKVEEREKQVKVSHLLKHRKEI